MSGEYPPGLHPETLTIGHGYDPASAFGAAKPPVFLTSTFVYESAQHAKDVHRAFFDGVPGPKGSPYIYSRLNHPNLDMVEKRLSVLDRGEDAAVFASGMAAISAIMLCFARPGETILHTKPTYGGTDGMLYNFLPQWGVHPFGVEDGLSEVSLQAAANRALEKGPLALIMLESPANPTGSIVDIAAARRVADAVAQRQGHRPLVSVDNTFLGPFVQSPLALGADLCVTALTKYCGGHSDLLAGGVSGAKALVGVLKAQRTFFGSHLDPFSSWLLLRSFETLALRCEKAASNALAVATYLNSHPKIASLTYLGFLPEGSPAQAVMQRQCRGAGSTFSFQIKGGEAEAFRMLDQLKVLRLAVSLGGSETLICHPATTTHYNVPIDRRLEVGVTDGTMRVSVGIEHPDDLIADLDQALAAV
jgi:cystathionine gamma-synthase/methionine-gamma-lyase